jgi:hypothetical protein
MVGSGEKGVNRKMIFGVVVIFLFVIQCEDIGKFGIRNKGGCRPEVSQGRYLIAFKLYVLD